MTHNAHWFDMFGKRVSLIALKPVDTSLMKNMFRPVPIRYFVPMTIVKHWQHWADWRFPRPIWSRKVRMFLNGEEMIANQRIRLKDIKA